MGDNYMYLGEMARPEFWTIPNPVTRRGTQEFTTDDAGKISKGTIKYDGGKAPVFRGAIDYFPRAIEQVAAVSAFGASKYAWKGWQDVSEGFERYSDAMVRHLTAEGKGEVTDGDSGLLHAAHAAWGALARLELLLRQQEDAKEGYTFNGCSSD